MSNSDCQTYGKEELPGEESWSRGDSWIDLHHLLWQDRNFDPEPNDRRSHVVWQPDSWSRHHRETRVEHPLTGALQLGWPSHVSPVSATVPSSLLNKKISQFLRSVLMHCENLSKIYQPLQSLTSNLHVADAIWGLFTTCSPYLSASTYFGCLPLGIFLSPLSSLEPLTGTQCFPVNASNFCPLWLVL